MHRIPIDWQNLTLNLRKYKSLTKLAQDIGCDAATLNKIQRGEIAEPRFTVGIHLLDLHWQLSPEKHKQLIK